MPEQGNVRENSDGGCGKVAKGQTEPSSQLVPVGVSFFFYKKRMIRGIGNALFSNLSQTSNGQQRVVTLTSAWTCSQKLPT